MQDCDSKPWKKKLLMKITFSIQASGSKFIKIVLKNKVHLSSIDCFLKQILLVVKDIASPLKPLLMTSILVLLLNVKKYLYFIYLFIILFYMCVGTANKFVTE